MRQARSVEERRIGHANPMLAIGAPDLTEVKNL